MSKEVHRIYFCKDGAILDTQAKDGEDIKDTLNRCFKKITDLEAKLAESENTILNIKEANDSFSFMAHYICEHLGKNNICPKDVNDFVESFEQLKQQLAESETDLSLARNEIDTLKHNLKVAQEHDNVMCEQYFEKCKNANQDKISFAVEQLEWLKEKVNNAKIYKINMINTHELYEILDNQIEELKKEMK